MDHAANDGARCLWQEAPRRSAGEAVTSDLDVEVAIIGAGIVGLTTGLLAAERGLSTAILEARHVGAGTSGATTGKFSVSNGLRYQRLRARHGREGAATYAMASRTGVELAERLVEHHDIECGFERVSSHLAVDSDEHRRALEDEVAAAADAGLRPIRGWDGHEFPLKVSSVATFRDEAQLHPMAYLVGLADAFVAAGGQLAEGSPVTQLARDGDRWRLTTGNVDVRADHVVVATRLPAVGDHRLTFARSKPVGAGAIAGVLADDGELPRSTALVVGERTWSVRSSRWPAGERHLVVVGPDIPTAQQQRSTDAVEAWVRAPWPTLQVTHRWFAQDQQPVDDRPLVGRLRDGSVWTATGFGKWGLALGTYAAERIVAGISGDERHPPRFFSPRKLHLRRSLRPLISANTTVAGRWLRGRLAPGVSSGELGPGEGRVRRVGARHVAEACGHDGTVHRLDARCTHLGCPVTWNRTSTSWDCRCHGARFAIDGAVLEAPATEPLQRLEPPPDH